MATYNCTQSDVDNFDVARFRDDITIALAEYGEAVDAELDRMQALRDEFPQQYAQACIAFAIMSPQCQFDVNVRGTRRFMDGLYRSIESVDDMYQLITNNGSDSWFTAGMSARSLYASLDAIRNIDELTLDGIDTLRKIGAIRGLGSKTRAMALALYDRDYPVFTLDVHMLRGMVADVDTGITITDKRYAQLADMAISVAREYGNVFLVQWCLWNHYRNGAMQSHLGIFGVTE